MTKKINMFISNGNILPPITRSILGANGLATTTITATPTTIKAAPTALNASIIARIHNVKPGCGSCGRK